jgi:hypothetical protein
MAENSDKPRQDNAAETHASADQPKQRAQYKRDGDNPGSVVMDYETHGHRDNVGPTGLPLTWVVSNRADNRMVGAWKDPNQPGGEVSLGPGVELVAKTAEIEALIQQGLIIEVPEPKRWLTHPETNEPMRDEQGRTIPNPKYPAPKQPDPNQHAPAQPGHPTPLGRALDPDLFDEDQIAEIRRRQSRLPREIPAPVGGIVPGITHAVS